MTHYDSVKWASIDFKCGAVWFEESLGDKPTPDFEFLLDDYVVSHVVESVLCVTLFLTLT